MFIAWKAQRASMLGDTIQYDSQAGCSMGITWYQLVALCAWEATGTPPMSAMVANLPWSPAMLANLTWLPNLRLALQPDHSDESIRLECRYNQN